MTALAKITRKYKTNGELLQKKTEADVAVIDMPLLDTRVYKDLMGTFIATLCFRFFRLLLKTSVKISRNVSLRA